MPSRSCHGAVEVAEVGQREAALKREGHHAFGGPQALALETGVRQQRAQLVGPGRGGGRVPRADHGQAGPQLGEELGCELAVPGAQQLRGAGGARAVHLGHAGLAGAPAAGVQHLGQLLAPTAQLLQRAEREGRAPHRDEAQRLVGHQVGHGREQRVIGRLGQRHLLRHRLRQVGQQALAPRQHLHVVVDVAGGLAAHVRRDPGQRPVVRAAPLLGELAVQITHPGADDLVQLFQEQLAVRDPFDGRCRAAGGLVAHHRRIDHLAPARRALALQRLGVVAVGRQGHVLGELLPGPVGAHAAALTFRGCGHGGQPTRQAATLDLFQLAEVSFETPAPGGDEQFEELVAEGCSDAHAQEALPRSRPSWTSVSSQTVDALAPRCSLSILRATARPSGLCVPRMCFFTHFQGTSTMERNRLS